MQDRKHGKKIVGPELSRTVEGKSGVETQLGSEE